MEIARQKSYVKSYREGQYTKYKPCSEMPVISTLEDLIRELYAVFESETVNVEYVQQLMTLYKTNPVDWRKYAKFDRCRYTRNLVDEGNGKFNLLILCWGEGHGSAIHDHADAHCFMKILQGSLNEVRFAWPERNRISKQECVDNHDDNSRDHNVLKETSREELKLNEVAYINDSIGLHRVENLSNINPAVSLHLYCPPYTHCNMFNELTGQSTLTKVTFWSKFGEKRDRDIQSFRDPEDN